MSRLVQPDEMTLLKELLKRATGYYKQRFTVKAGNKLQFRQVNEVAYFFADGKEAYLVTRKENRKYIIENTLEELESALDPLNFFRISRKFIIAIDSIAEVKGLMGSRLEVRLNQPCEHDLSVSRNRAQEFKKWLNR